MRIRSLFAMSMLVALADYGDAEWASSEASIFSETELLLPAVQSWSGKSEALMVSPGDPWVTPAEQSGLNTTPTYEETVQWLIRIDPGEPVKEVLEITFPAGSYRISTDQPLGELLMLMLEPQAPDSFLQWGFFLEIFTRTEYAEAYIMEPLAQKKCSIAMLA